MAVHLNQIIAKMSPARRKQVEARAAGLIAEEMSLRQLRKARRLTQIVLVNRPRKRRGML